MFGDVSCLDFGERIPLKRKVLLVIQCCFAVFFKSKIRGKRNLLLIPLNWTRLDCRNDEILLCLHSLASQKFKLTAVDKDESTTETKY